MLGDLKKTRRAAYADSMHKNHKTQWRASLHFCFSFDLKPLPATLDTVCLYCQFLSRSRTPRSTHNYLGGVKLLHVFTGFDFPFYDAPELKLTLRGLDRILKHALLRAPPVMLELLQELIKCATYSPRDLVFSCAFLFAFFLFAWISNLAPASISSFNPSKQLCRGDIVVTRFGLLVSFKWSKTNQTGSKLLKVPFILQILICARFVHTFECVLDCLRLHQCLCFSRVTVQARTLSSLNHNLFRFSVTVWLTWVSMTLLVLGDTGRSTHINVTLNSRMMPRLE